MADLEQRQTNGLMRQRMQLEEAKETGYAAQDMANDIKVNLAGQHEQLRGRVLGNLFDIQKETSISGRLLLAIERQRSRNKYVLWAVYGLIGLVILFILY